MAAGIPGCSVAVPAWRSPGDRGCPGRLSPGLGAVRGGRDEIFLVGALTNTALALGATFMIGMLGGPGFGEMAAALADREAIRELIYSYCRSVDRRDVALGQSIWHEDGQADYGSFFQGPGRDSIALICQSHAPLISRSHQVSNIIIELDVDNNTGKPH